MIAGDSSRHSLVAVGIVLVHAAAFYALTQAGPRLQRTVSNKPVAVRFVSVSPPRPQWQPPQVKVVAPAILTQMPELPLIDVTVSAPPSERAITASLPQRSESPSAAVDPSVPKVIATVEYLRQPSPRYPPQSRKLREQGLVVLRVLIDERGLACNIDVESSSGHARLDDAAKDAVARAAFRPYIEDGTPRRALVLIPIEFALNRSAA